MPFSVRPWHRCSSARFIGYHRSNLQVLQDYGRQGGRRSKQTPSRKEWVITLVSRDVFVATTGERFIRRGWVPDASSL